VATVGSLVRTTLTALATALVVAALPYSTQATAADAPAPTVFGFSTPTFADLARVERRLDVTTGMVSVFADFTDPFPVDAATAASTRGVPLVIAWEPWDSDRGGVRQPEYRLRRITAGAFDEYMRAWLASAQAVVDAGTPVLVRWAPEMNGDWRPWSTYLNGNRVGDYVRAWQHVWQLAQSNAAPGVAWMWNPIVDFQRVRMADVYPGGEYVDVVALDGYNWGAVGLGWQTFDVIFDSSIRELRRLAPGKPWAIAEIGCAPGSLKTRWVANALRRAHAEGAAFVLWFEFVKETDWRMSGSPRTARTVTRIVSDPAAWSTG
jgi:beta-mannanase